MLKEASGAGNDIINIYPRKAANWTKDFINLPLDV